MSAPLPIRVLVLEDNPSDAELMVDALRQAGFDPQWDLVDSAAGFADQLGPTLDLILSDYSLPQFSGMEALRLVRAHGLDVPFILVSGSIGEEIAVEAMRGSADDYLLKDRMARLGPAVRQALETRRLRVEKKHAEAAQRDSDARFRQMAEHIREVFWLTDPSKNEMLYVSPAYEEIWGRRCEELFTSPRAWIEAIHPEDRGRVLEAAQTRQALGGYAEEYRILRPDGSMRWIWDRAFPVLDDAGNVIRIAGIAEDITERKRAVDALRESERRFSDMLGKVELVSLMLDRDARITYCNDYLLQLTGWRREEVLARNWFERFLPPPHAEVRVAFAALLADQPAAWHHENEILTRSGSRRLVHWNNSVLRSAEGEVIGTASIGEDVTERKVQEQKIGKLSRIRAVSSEINALIVRAGGRRELLEAACRIAVEQGNFGIAWIGELDRSAMEIAPVACAGLGAQYYLGIKSSISGNLPQGRGLLAAAIRTQRPAFDNDITRDPEAGGARRQEAIHRGFRSAIVLPFILEHSVIATLSLFAREVNFFDDEEVALLTELAGNISFALEHMARQDKFEKLSRIRAVSGEINAVMVRVREREELLRETCRIASEHGKFGMVWIASLDLERQEVRPVAWAGFSPQTAHAVTWASISATRGTLGEAILTLRAAVRNDMEGEMAVGNLRQEALAAGCGSTVCLPLLVDGKMVAAIILFATGTNFFDDEELALLNELAADVSFALQTIAGQEKLDYLSYYDPLTGLPNRTLFLDRAGQQLHARGGERLLVALVLINLDRFRNINETFGRNGGDELLKLVAQRLESAVHGKDYLARIGADGFGTIIRGLHDVASIVHVLESQLFASFRQSFSVGDQELRVAAKAGIAIFPTDGSDADTLFRNAEAALRRAKGSTEPYLFYASDMNARAAQALSLENRLCEAVEAQQFVLHYQPKIKLLTGTICGLEALIRWQEPGAGLVPPGVFIPVLEETGLIIEVGKWALGRALADHREWTARGRAAPRIAVNVSAIQLQRRDFADTVIEIVQREGDNPDALELEVTESMFMRDVQSSIRALTILRGLGIRVAMDDFGTGYSSLSYMARLPIDTVKIDRSFVNAMAGNRQDMAIVTTIIALAHALDLKVVAEGVETAEQASTLASLKCDEVQGYFYSKPVPAAEIEALLPSAQP